MVLASCERPVHKGYKPLENGIHYHLISFSAEGDPIPQGAMVRFTLSVYQGDSLGWSTGVESVIQADSSAKGLKSLLGYFEVDDSISFRINKEVVAYDFGSRLDTSLGYGAIRMKLLETISEKKWQSDMEEIASLRRGMERARIESYLDSVKTVDSAVFEAWEGLYWRVLKKGTRTPLSFGEVVNVGYECYTLDGRLIDVQLTDSEPMLSFKRGMQGVLIPGMEKIVLMMPQDAVIEAILPSEQGYGSRGVPEVGIRAWMPLRFVILLDSGPRSS
jgi:peptidylprolyl isomerase